MRYRKLDQNGDMQFGHGEADFWKDDADAVGQSVKTRLLLFTGEWFLNLADGTPWGGFPLNPVVVEQGRILAEQTRITREAAIRDRIISTYGVLNMPTWGSSFDPTTRTFSVNATINTIYGGPLFITAASAPGAHPTVELKV